MSGSVFIRINGVEVDPKNAFAITEAAVMFAKGDIFADDLAEKLYKVGLITKEEFDQIVADCL